MTFENLKLKRLIIHEVFTRELSGSVPPALNEQLADLDEQSLNELELRIINAVGNDSHSIKMDIVQGGDGSVFNYVQPIFTSEVEESIFVSISKNVVQKLASSQMSRTIPGGVVVFFDGTISSDNRKCIGIIKAEKHSGFSLLLRDQVRVLQFINDLLLTPQQKLYKIAFLTWDNSSGTSINIDNVEVFIFDSNNVKNEGKTAANYFYDGFMGCTFPKTSDILTRDFFFATKEFITKKSNLSGEERVDKMSALYTYLKVENSETISVAEFSERYFSGAETKDEYSNFMGAKKIPMNSIHKDMEMLKGKLRRRKVKFSNDVYIYAPVDDFSENVKILTSTESTTDIRIRGHINSES